MSIVSYFKYGLWRFLEIICHKFNIYIFIKTGSGLKNVNMDCLYGEKVLDNNPEKVIYLNPSQLFLSIDYLKDKYTLLDCCIEDSPHYSFIEAINTGKDLKKTDYYKRFISGRLDGRHCQRERNLTYFYDKNGKVKASIEYDDYKPVVVFFWKGRYYIYDGKHRAAFCAWMKKDVKCLLVPPIPSISDFPHLPINREIFRIMSWDNQYSKHINFLNDGEK